MSDFPALPGYYNLLFLQIEPVSTILPAVLAWVFPGAAWFHDELIPTMSPAGLLDPRSKMAIWQLGNCYMLLGLLSIFVFRAVRDTLRHDPVAQERILGASFTALAIADATHVAASFIGLPSEVRYSPLGWNPMTHGNITFTLLLMFSRLAWFMGLGRTTYYYGKGSQSKRSKSA